jgi:formylglycine-generating enzyme required for sulfatase activity
MARRVLKGLLWVAAGSGLVACAALTGASDLAICEGDTCADTATPETGPGEDGAIGEDAGADTSLPPNCTAGQIACDGNQRATCENDAWVRTPCAQACVAGACVLWPNCRALADAGCGTTDYCANAAVPGGTFDRHGNSNRPATISGFKLDLFEVTVARFRPFVAASLGTQAAPPAVGAGAHPKIAGSGWQSTWNQYLPANTAALTSDLVDSDPTWTTNPGANELKPIVNVKWLVAFAFCAWDGGRLPTRAELNYAASGGSEHRTYPWGSTTPSGTTTDTRANWNCLHDSPVYTNPPSYCSSGNGSPCVASTCAADGGSCINPAPFGCEGAIDVAPVGFRPAGAGRWGHFDLAGKVKEFVLDRFPGGTGDPPAGACNDCALLMPADPDPPMAGKEDALLLGGDYNDTSNSDIRTTAWTQFPFDATSAWTGFRCARD